MSWLDSFFTGIRTVVSKGFQYTERQTLDFEGDVTVSDDPANNRTVVTVNGSGGVAFGNGIQVSGGVASVKPNSDGSVTVDAAGVRVGVMNSDTQHGSRGNGPLHDVADASNDGFMSAANFTKLGAATSSNTPSTIVMRDGSGGVSVGSFSAAGQANFDGYVVMNPASPGITATGTGSDGTVYLITTTQSGSNTSRGVVVSSGGTANAISGILNLLTGTTTGAFRSGPIILGTGSTNNAGARSGDTTITTGEGLAGEPTGDVNIYSGKSYGAGKSGNVGVASGVSNSGQSGDVHIFPNPSASTIGNISLGANLPNFQSGQMIIYIKNCTAAPSGNPSGGGFFYVESGALKYRGSSGTVTTIAPA